MKKRKPGNSALEVSAPGLGCMGLSYGPETTYGGFSENIVTGETMHSTCLQTSTLRPIALCGDYSLLAFETLEGRTREESGYTPLTLSHLQSHNQRWEMQNVLVQMRRSSVLKKAMLKYRFVVDMTSFQKS